MRRSTKRLYVCVCTGVANMDCTHCSVLLGRVIYVCACVCVCMCVLRLRVLTFTWCMDVYLPVSAPFCCGAQSSANMLHTTAIFAICLVLASEASAFVPSASLPLSTTRVASSPHVASVVCAAEAPGRRELLQRAAVFSGAIFLKGPASAFAEDDADDAPG